ncbi:MAG: 50S ribosomal protein L19 [Mycoplasmataceae bacterium]|jgi:large subunit ribosomal protein L19|nr:50S ribosomal protein L19 [Mycoplasmataceae bacterium]
MAKIDAGSLIKKIEKSQMRTDLPSFSAGDTIRVFLKIQEGAKTRMQRIDGIVLRVRGKGSSKTFILRKESSGIGVEQSFNYHSPLIIKIEVVKKGKVRRAYISYMRERSGKSARVKVKN